MRYSALSLDDCGNCRDAFSVLRSESKGCALHTGSAAAVTAGDRALSQQENKSAKVNIEDQTKKAFSHHEITHSSSTCQVPTII